MIKEKILLMVFLLLSTQVVAATIKTQEEYVAGVIYAEALGQSDYAKGLIATTIWIRAGGNPALFRPVCKLEKQYARPQRNDDSDWQSCMKFAKSMYAGTFRPLAYQDHNGKWVHPDHVLKHSWAHSVFLCPFWAREKSHKKVDDLCFFVLGKFRRVELENKIEKVAKKKTNENSTVSL